MDALMMVADYLGEDARAELARIARGARVTEVRLRAAKRPLAAWRGGDAEFGRALSPEGLTRAVSAMLEHSLYAWEDELGMGYFTLPGGSRAGVTGRFAVREGRVRLACISSVCVRIAREARGCAGALVSRILREGRADSAIVLSPPGMGKTTLLRDAARLLSGAGLNVAIADERGEIAACRGGVPGMDVGARTDVADGLFKAEAIARLVRSMAPDVIITDELGARRDALAVREAARMGVAVVASAHAGSLAQAVSRPMLRPLLTESLFAWAFVLGGAPGQIVQTHRYIEGDRDKWRLS